MKPEPGKKGVARKAKGSAHKDSSADSIIKFNPDHYPPGDLPALTPDELQDFAKNKRPSPHQLDALASEHSRALRKIERSWLLPDRDERESSALATAVIAPISAFSLAKVGAKFTGGRKKNTGGPIRKAIATLLGKNPTMKNPELWDAISKKPPRNWAFHDNRHGKYFEGPENVEMKKGRFDTVCGEERKKLKK